MAYCKHSKISGVIAFSLRDRNEKEKRFENIVKLCNSLHESVDLLEKENVRLKIQNAKIEKPDHQTEKTAEGTSTVDTVGIGEYSLQKKIYELQTEITELHRNKGEHAQKIIDLKREKEEKEREIAVKNSELETLKIALKVAKEKQCRFEDKATDAEANLQLVKDEYSALLLTYTSLKQSREILESEYKDLTARWLLYKAKAVDELNAENEMMQRFRQMRIQREMEEAIREPVPSMPCDKRRETT